MMEVPTDVKVKISFRFKIAFIIYIVPVFIDKAPRYLHGLK